MKIFNQLSSALLLILLTFFPFLGKTQYFVAGQDPGTIKWHQIQTSHFQFIYPNDYEIEAQRVARIFEKVYNFSGITLQHQPKKISVILHSKSARSNGFVAWSPSRIELFTTPGQEIYAQDWIEQLAIHELRHHVQIDKIESELPSVFKVLLGEQAASVVIGAYLPFWFLEGDAVVSETALSHSGRGRLSSFSMELKAQADEKGIFSFDKAYLGSYKDYVPDYYQLGYQIVSNIRRQNGGEVWGNVLHHIARNPLALNSLSKGLKLATGKNQDEHYREIMGNLKSSNAFQFNNQNDTMLFGKRVVKSSKDYVSYRFPNFVNDSTFVALKTSLDHIPELVLIDKSLQEKKLFSPGQVLDESLCVSNGNTAWIESKPDVRWTYQDKSLLRILNIRNGKLKEKIFSTKLFAPAMSPDGKLIAAVKFDTLNHCSIVIIDITNNQIISEFKTEENHQFITPSWATDAKILYAIDLGQNGKSIVRIDPANGKISRITQPIFGEIKKPVERDNMVYYTANQSGKFDGFVLDLQSKQHFRIVSSKYGIRDLQISKDGKTLLYADYSAYGFKIAQKLSLRKEWEVMNQESWFQDTLSTGLAQQEKGAIDFSRTDSTLYKSTKYSKFKNLINFHSWSPLYIDPDQSVVNIGFSVVSQNKLTTAITQFGYDYSTVNQAGKWIGKFEYTGWFPIVRLYGDYGKENSNYYQINKHYNLQNVLIKQDTVAIPYTQKVMNLHLDAVVPFNFSSGKMYRMIEPEIQIGYSQHWQSPSTSPKIFRGSYIPISYRLYAHNMMQQSSRDIQTKWGQILDLQYRHTPLGDRKLGQIASAEGTFYFPGFTNTHGIRVYFGFQEKKSENSLFNDLIYYPRGYTSMENTTLSSLRSDYVLPVLSPDWHIRRLYYLKRVTLRLFYDYANITMPIHQTNSTIKKYFSSTGAELLTECHFLRFIAPVKLGVRECYLIQSKQLTSELLLSINFKGM